MKVVKFENKHSKGLFELLNQEWSIEHYDEFLSHLVDLPSTMEIYVAEDGNEVIGTATLHYQKKLIRNGSVAGLIEEVVVDENRRGQRIGQSIIKQVTEKAFENNCYKVILSCTNERVEFYKRCGYKLDANTMRINRG